MSDLSLSDAVDDNTAKQLRDRIWAAVPDWHADKIGEFQFLSGGYSNANFAFSRRTSGVKERYVLRMPQRNQPYVNRVAETQWYQRLPSSIGIQPLVLDIQTGLMISPWVDGVLLVDTFEQHFNPDDLLNYLTKLHRALPVTYRQYHVPSLLSDLVGDEIPPNAITAACFMEDGTNTDQVSPIRLTSCHNDLNPWNILVTESGWITLDWEFAGTNDPLFDLVCLHQGLNLSDKLLPEMAAALVSSVIPDLIPDIELPRLNTALEHFWLREWAWATFQQRSGNTRSEVAEQIATATGKLNNLKAF